MKKHNCTRDSLTVRLTAYSVLAGAALAFTSVAQGEIVPLEKHVGGSAASLCEAALFQSQHLQTQRVRHQRHAGMRVMSTSTCTPTPTPTPTPAE